MSAQAMGWALDQDLPARTKLVLVAIANHADHTDGYCWLKAATIAAEASCTPRSVFRHIGALIRNGYVKRASKRGADGKQRANDYWILFNREDVAWDWGGAVADTADDDSAETTDAETHASDSADPLDVDGAEAVETPILSHGDGDSGVPRADEKAPILSHGPCAIGVSHKDSAEPSKTNPENVGLRTSRPRRYAPPPAPPPQPMGATTLEGTGDLIFVFVGTPAYEAWKAIKTRQTGRPWNCKDIKNGRFGWHFPTLFPPPEKPPPHGAATPLATEEDFREFAKG